MRKPRSTSLRYRVLLFLCRLFGIIFVVLLSASLLCHSILAPLSRSDSPQHPVLTQEELDAFLGVDTYAQALSWENGSGPLTQIGGRGSGIVNILLIGQDRRAEEGRARSDAIILCTLHADTGKLTMTSFLRDLYVPIPGYRDNRINAAYAAGGMPLMKQTFLENFGIYVDGCVEVDFNQFSRIVDTLGGVSVELRQDEADFINSNASGNLLSAGIQLLNGDQALTYARIRKLDADGDFSRTGRHRKILSALVTQFRNADITQLTKLAGSLLPMISTDLNEGKLLLYAAQFLPCLSNMEIISQQIPAEGTYTHQNINGMAVLVPDLEETRAYLAESLLGE